MCLAKLLLLLPHFPQREVEDQAEVHRAAESEVESDSDVEQLSDEPHTPDDPPDSEIEQSSDEPVNPPDSEIEQSSDEPVNPPDSEIEQSSDEPHTPDDPPDSEIEQSSDEPHMPVNPPDSEIEQSSDEPHTPVNPPDREVEQSSYEPHTPDEPRAQDEPHSCDEPPTQNEPHTQPPTTSCDQRSSSISRAQGVDESTSSPTFKIIGDNIDKKVKPRYMREDRQAQMLNNFHLYAVKDRVDLSDLSEELPSLRAFEELKFQDILPSCNDRDEILESYVTLFARIVTAEIPFFKQFQDVVPLHIAHQHSREMERKSEVVSSYLNWIYTP